jgi:hypothetical protein
MPAVRTIWLDHTLFALALVALLALSWPGVEARAEGDIAPSARALTSLSSGAIELPSTPARSGATCQASAPVVDPQRAGAQRAAMQRLAQAMQAEGFVVMNGRGHAYPTENDPTAELMKIQAEAAHARRK